LIISFLLKIVKSFDFRDLGKCVFAFIFVDS